MEADSSSQETPVKSVTDILLPKKLNDFKIEQIREQGNRLALVSDLWRHAHPSQSCDLLVLLPAMHRHAQALATELVTMVRSRERDIKIEVRYHALTGAYALYFTAKYNLLLRGAELLHLRKPVKEQYGGGMREFSVDERDCFQGVGDRDSFLTQHERSVIVKTLLEAVRAQQSFRLTLQPDEVESNADDLEQVQPMVIEIAEGQAIVPTLLRLEHIEQVLPLHDLTDLKQLQRTWVSAVFDTQPLDRIKRYFGSQIAVYFAWLGHYTFMLSIPAVLGMIIYYMDVLTFEVADAARKLDANETEHNHDEWFDTQLLSDVVFVLFALFNCVWSTVYLESWKRRQAELAYTWGHDTEENWHVLKHLQEARPAFRPDRYELSPVTGLLEPTVDSWQVHKQRWLVSAPLTAGCIGLVVALMFCMLRAQSLCHWYLNDTIFWWLGLLPVVLYALLILIGDALYRQFAAWLNEMENYRTEAEYENGLVIKMVIYQCCSAYGSLFYIAFYLKDIHKLRETLATLLISRQVIQNIIEVALPWLTERAKRSRLTLKMTANISEATLREHVEMRQRRRTNTNPDVLDVVNASNENLEAMSNAPSPVVSPMIERYDETSLRHRFASDSLDSDNAPSPSFKRKSTRIAVPEFKHSSPEISHAELECLMPKYATPLEDYLEMCVQFGYVLLFSPAFPLAAACALMNNLLEIRVDAFKLCNNVQRPFGRRHAASIGAWQKAMEVIGVVGVLVNCALIGQSGLVARIWPGTDWAAHLVIVVTLEHLILALKWCLDAAIPDQPEWVSVQRARMEHQRREAIKRDLRRYRKSSTAIDGTAKMRMPQARHRSITPSGDRQRSVSPIR